MQLSEMKIGRSLEVHISREGYRYKVARKIVEVGAGHVYIEKIASATRVFEFRKTDAVDIVYYEGEKLWKWTNVAPSLVELDGEEFHCFITIEEGESYNRRNNFRLNLGERIALYYSIHSKNANASKKAGEAHQNQLAQAYGIYSDVSGKNWQRYRRTEAFLQDISESGVGLYTAQILSVGDEVAFELETEMGKIDGEAIVVRSLNRSFDVFPYYYGCRFTEHSNNLTKFIYEMQRQQLRRARSRVK